MISDLEMRRERETVIGEDSVLPADETYALSFAMLESSPSSEEEDDDELSSSELENIRRFFCLDALDCFFPFFASV